jgi:glucokinase
MNEQKFVLSADIGGSHITAAIIDIDKRRICEETITRIPVDCHGSQQEILHSWSRCLMMAEEKAADEIVGLSLALPGPFEYDTGVSRIKGLSKYESLYGVNIKHQLAGLLGMPAESMLFKNDAESFLHGEVHAGAAKGYNKVIGFTLGTGMGSAISIGGRTADANWGAISFGGSIADDFFSTRWFLSAYLRNTGKTCTNVRDMATLAETDSGAMAVFRLFAKNFAGFVQRYISDHKPDVVVIGGNIAKAAKLFMPDLKQHLRTCIDPGRIVLANLDEHAALLGAAMNFTEDNQVKIRKAVV